jgi:trk system potassium uptake protein TrkA
VRWTADRIVRHLIPEGMVELWRDPTSIVAIMEVPVHHDWISRPLHDLEEASGARIAYIMRFGLGALPTPSMRLQDGDQVFMLVTDEMMEPVKTITAAPPEGGH